MSNCPLLLAPISKYKRTLVLEIEMFRIVEVQYAILKCHTKLNLVRGLSSNKVAKAEIVFVEIIEPHKLVSHSTFFSH